MILTALATGLITATLIIGGLILILLYAKRRIVVIIKEFATPPDDKTPSPFAQVVDAVAFTASQRLVMQLKTSLMGMNSVDSRNARREGVNEAVSSSPVLKTILTFLPGVSKRLNPDTASAIVSLLSRFGGNGHQTGSVVNQSKLEL
jgi:hypothetical protein